MYLCTSPDGSQYVTDCEEAVLVRQAALDPSFSFQEILYLPTSSIRHHLWECRAKILKDLDLDKDFPDRRGRRICRDPLINSALDELMEDF